MSVLNHLKSLLNSAESFRIFTLSHIPIFSPFSRSPIISSPHYLILSFPHHLILPSPHYLRCPESGGKKTEPFFNSSMPQEV